jgi:lysophospholipase L1-like esterase
MFAVTVLAPPHLSVSRFLAFGDSITWGEDGKNAPSGLSGATLFRPTVQLPTPDTYPGALQDKLAARYTAQSPQVTNAGRPGETLTDPATLSRFVGYTSSGSYDVVLLMEGANDLGNPNVSEVIAGLGRLIDDAKGRQIPVLLATIPPENPNGYDPKNRGINAAQVAPFNDHVRELAASKGVPLVDVYQAFGGDLTLIGTDGLHPTAAGYHLIADTFFASIKHIFEQAPVPSSSRMPVQTRSVRRPAG